jgi:hypothetical protein
MTGGLLTVALSVSMESSRIQGKSARPYVSKILRFKCVSARLPVPPKPMTRDGIVLIAMIYSTPDLKRLDVIGRTVFETKTFGDVNG